MRPPSCVCFGSCTIVQCFMFRLPVPSLHPTSLQPSRLRIFSVSDVRQPWSLSCCRLDWVGPCSWRLMCVKPLSIGLPVACPASSFLFLSLSFFLFLFVLSFSFSLFFVPFSFFLPPPSRPVSVSLYPPRLPKSLSLLRIVASHQINHLCSSIVGRVRACVRACILISILNPMLRRV